MQGETCAMCNSCRPVRGGSEHSGCFAGGPPFLVLACALNPMEADETKAVCAGRADGPRAFKVFCSRSISQLVSKKQPNQPHVCSQKAGNRSLLICHHIHQRSCWTNCAAHLACCPPSSQDHGTGATTAAGARRPSQPGCTAGKLQTPIAPAANTPASGSHVGRAVWRCLLGMHTTLVPHGCMYACCAHKPSLAHVFSIQQQTQPQVTAVLTQQPEEPRKGMRLPRQTRAHHNPTGVNT